MNTRQLQLYMTAESPCSYFTDRTSRNLIPDPAVPLNMPLYSQLLQHGFRRSGRFSYRPCCRHCQACIACRIPVQQFTASRSQKRCYKRNRDLELTVVKAAYTNEYFDLYRRYLDSRHGEGSMANPSEQDFEQFLYSEWSDTRFLELRLNGQLLAVAVTDATSHALSAVYSFFQPELDKRSLGTCCILTQIDYARKLGLDYLYLGYWIENHKKMHYKQNFKPLQLYLDESWQEWPRESEKPDN